MNPHNQQIHDLFNGDTFTADDYHQDYQEGLYQTTVRRSGVIVTLLILGLTFVYGILVRFNYDLLPIPQLIWNAFVYMTPIRLLVFIDKYTNQFPIPNPNMKRGTRTHSEKSEIMRRIFGLDTPGSIIDTVASAGRSRLSSISLIGLGPGGSGEIPAGLGNWDNSCYQNSVLQALASLDTLPKYLEDIRTTNKLLVQEGSNSEFTKMEMASSLEELIAILKSPSNNGRRIWTPTALKNMSSWQQQDAQEYFSRLLDAIDNEYAAAVKPRRLSGWGMEQTSKDISSPTLESQAFAHNPLRGATATSLVCTKCGYSEGLKLNPSLCVPLIVGDGWEYDLSQLLDEATKLEFVHDVYCSRCTLRKHEHLLLTLMSRLENEPEDSRLRLNTSERLQAVTEALENDEFSEKSLKEKCKIPKDNWVKVAKSKQDTIARPPKSLVLHLNRSAYTMEGQLTKKTAAIRFPKHLDLGPYCLGSAGGNDESLGEEWFLSPRKSMVAGSEQRSRVEGPIYELRAVITHHGRHENGHYICHRKHPVPETKLDDNEAMHDQWWRLSDDHVVKTGENDVLRQGQVFMLFYDQIHPAVASVDFMPEEEAAATPLPSSDDTDLALSSNDHAKSQEEAASNISEIDDEESEAGQNEEYSPTKAILVPQTYIAKNGGLGGQKREHGSMGSLVMV